MFSKLAQSSIKAMFI
ncbi:hypothetical protein [Escherichia coli]|nr:hypothetical protein [Escherichia coli]MDX5579526.1 hypothetical protein [Escherichia coli]